MVRNYGFFNHFPFLTIIVSDLLMRFGIASAMEITPIEGSISEAVVIPVIYNRTIPLYAAFDAAVAGAVICRP